MEQFTVNQIGKIKNNGGEITIELEQKYIPALKGLDGFSHLNVFWWFDDCDNEISRNSLEALSPYKGSPEVMGTFATRSPMRPNPLALTTVQILFIEPDMGIIHIPYIDANDNTPVIDLKPYTPSLDRIENPKVPEWCSHWPKSVEESANFDWASQFNF